MKARSAPVRFSSCPHGIVVEPANGGWLLKPGAKPRRDWEKIFRKPSRSKADDVASVRKVRNDFDQTEWEW